MLALAILVLAIWAGMLTLRDGFWRADVTDRAVPPAPQRWPSIVAIVPARDEAAVIAPVIASLIRQDYAGEFRIILVDDSSSDGTAAIARAAAAGSDRLTVMSAAPLASGWTGKLAAVSQGIAAASSGINPPDFLWLTDADIQHAPDTLASLASRAMAEDRVLVSLMARLRCESLAERMLIPAFVFFFQLLYPFAAINRPRRAIAGAAGGCMLVKRDALERAGGIAAIRTALIDDCALAALMKQQGPIWLGLTDRSLSIRPYPRFADVGAMIARSAYAQLGYQPLLLVGTIVGMALVYLAPLVLALAGEGDVRGVGAAAWFLMIVAFWPISRFYRQSPAWGLALPLIAAFYAGATVWSAWQHWRGRGGLWKGRAQAALQ
ncbi:glycosyltransferase [Novosphingobium sp.]|uniref:glycosyltransferase n=1 Tax=Novosphingobium sp. TaxID=1874826 RepID=UPI001DC99978|nr:glycosyltransferase [Novosphingobium sp.]MBX9664748.1 glycosyltransferase [Novosphingobium sp.]